MSVTSVDQLIHETGDLLLSSAEHYTRLNMSSGVISWSLTHRCVRCQPIVGVVTLTDEVQSHNSIYPTRLKPLVNV